MESDHNPMQRTDQPPRCTAHSKRSGILCKNPAVRGWAACRMHGANGSSASGSKHLDYRHGMRSIKIRKIRGLIRLLNASTKEGFPVSDQVADSSGSRPIRVRAPAASVHIRRFCGRTPYLWRRKLGDEQGYVRLSVRLFAFAAVQEGSWLVCGSFGRLQRREICHLRRMILANRSRPNPRMRLRWAKSISTFFLSRIETACCLIFAMSRAT